MALDTVRSTRAALEGVFVGQPKELWGGKPHSSIQKDTLHDSASVSFDGIFGDKQADLIVHGGLDKALCFYPVEHYAAWNREFKGVPKAFSPGSFGENISASIFNEENVFIGDVFRIGQCELQVTQGRTPCWKLNRHTGVRTMAKLFLETGRTGWYFRVLKEGIFDPRSTIELIGRGQTSHSVYDITMARVSVVNNSEYYRQVSEIPELSAGWKNSFAKKAVQSTQDSPKKAWEEPEFSVESKLTYSHAY